VIDPASGQPVRINELALLGSGGLDVAAAVRELGGTMVASVAETQTYQARFPVTTLDELDAIARALRARGMEATHVMVRNAWPSREAE
jgi:hypothetical protein